MRMTLQNKSFACLFTLASILMPLHAQATDYLVSDDDAFYDTLELVQPGDSIIWQDGTYDDLDTLRFEPLTNGTAVAPITFRAESPGGVTFRGTTRLGIGGTNLVVSGFRFDNSDFDFPDDEGTGWVIQSRAHSNKDRHAYNCRVTDCAIVNYDNPADTGSAKWIQWYGASNRFDNCFVSGKRTEGATFIVELNDGAEFKDDVVAHIIEQNVFADRPLHPEGLSANEQETLRLGTSSMSDQNARMIIQSNYFWRCSGEAEIISNKSCENTIRYNTFIESVGSLTLRHGRGCWVEGNVFFGGNVPDSGGIRIANQDHTVINNYMQDLEGTTYQAAMGIMAGSTWDGVSTSPDNNGGYVQVKNCLIAHNTILDSAVSVDWGVGLGGSGRTKEPADNTLTANIIVSSSAPLFTFTDNPTGTTYLSNLVYGATVGVTDPGIIVADPLLTADAQGLQRPSAAGPAAGNAATELLLPGTILDMDGAIRPLSGRDIGADEIGAGTAPLAPMAITDVGPTWIQSTAPPIVTENPENQNNATGTTITLSANGTGADPMVYQWRYNGVPLVEGGDISGADDRILAIANAELGDAGNYDVVLKNLYGSATSSVAVVTTYVQTYPPTISTNPTNLTVLTGANASFSVDADGTAPISYQWYFNTTTPLTGKTGTTLTLIGVDAADEGSYHAVATSAYGTDTSSAATLTVIPPDQPVSITVDPVDDTITAGQTANFSVTVEGTPPITYQWYYNTNTLLVGETSSTLSIANAQTNDTGMYSVAVTNGFGSDISTHALLTVNEAGPAGSYHYDSSTGTAGIQDGGNDWTSTGAYWLLDGTGPNVIWDDNGPNDAIFGGGTSGSAGYVDIPSGETRTVGNMTFIQPNDGQYVIDAGSVLTTSFLNLSGTPKITVADFPSDEDYQVQLKIIVSGTGFIKEGPGTLQLGGGSGTHNTYSGLVTVNEGTMIIRKGSDGIEAITAGGLLINEGGLVRMPKKRQINDAATVTVNGGTLEMVSSGGDTFASLVVAAGGVVENLDTGTNRELELTTSIDVQSGIIDGNAVKNIRIKGAAGLTKTTGGTVVLGAGFEGQYYGLTSVNGGSLMLNGEIQDSYRVDVNSGGTLGGTGSIENGVNVNSGGTLSPGESIGTLTMGELTLKAGSTTIMEVNASSATSDRVSGEATYAGALQVNNLSGTMVAGQTYQIFDAGGSGSFNSISPAPGSGLEWSFDAASGILSVVSGVNTTPADVMFGVSNGTVYLSWPEDHTGWQMQMQTNSLGTNWFPYPGSTDTNMMIIPIDPANTNAFYRLIYPPQP